MDPEPVRVVDCLGRPGPVPVGELARALPLGAPGEVVEVRSDAATRLQVPVCCGTRRHAHPGQAGRRRGPALRARHKDGA